MNGEVDLALVMLPFHSGTIRYEPLYREQIYLAVPKHSDVCQKLGGSESRELETEDLRKLQEEPFILYERGRRMYESLRNCAEVPDLFRRRHFYPIPAKA